MGYGWWKRAVAGVMAVCTVLVGGAVLARTGESLFALNTQAASETSSVTQVPLSSLLAALLPDGTDTPLTAAEADWLDFDTKDEGLQSLRQTLAVSHRTSLPLSLLTTEIHDEAVGGMTLRLSPYVDGGQTWLPSLVTVEGRAYVPVRTGDVYEVELPDSLTDSEAMLTVAVDYTTDYALNGEACDILANAAYVAVVAAKDQQADYRQALATYNAALERYNTYLEARKQYTADLQKYNQYVKALAQYERDLAAYRAYLAAMEEYGTKKAAYDAYLQEYALWQAEYDAYMAILNNPDAYNQKYQAYVQWQSDMALVKSQLTVVDSCYTPDPNDRRLYGTLRGDTVATVVNRQDELVSAGCDANDIAAADAATAALIDWLNGYQPLKTEPDKYDYYVRNYKGLRDNVKQLYTALARLYTNKIVPEILQMQGKLDRYHQFVAQLYVLWCALDDSTARDPNWTIAGKTAEQALIYSTFLLTDNNRATPLAGYPAEMEAVVPPSELREPQPPAEVTRPREPVAVAQPTEPAEVVKPTLPVTVARPTAPAAPAFSAYLLALMNSDAKAVTQGRTLDESHPIYTATVRQEWGVRTTDDWVMNFYSADGSALLRSLTVGDGDEFLLPDQAFLQSYAPQDTPRYTYVGIGWADEDGNWIGGCGERLTATSDGRFHGVYEAHTREYTVTWVIGEERISTTVPYGTLPVYPGHDSNRLIWSPAVTEVTGDAEYHGAYRTESHYTVTWKWGDGEDQQMQVEYAAGVLPEFPGDIPFEEDGRYGYTFLGWSPQVRPLDGDVLYEAVFDTVDRTPGLPDSAMVTVRTDEAGRRIATGSGWFTDGQYEFGLSALVGLAAAEDRPLALEADGITLLFRRESVAALARLNQPRLTVSVSRENNTFSFVMTEKVGDGRTEVTELAADVGLIFPSDYWVEMVASGAGSTSGLQMPEDGEVWFSVLSGEIYQVNEGYAVRVKPCEGGQVRFDSYVAKAGEAVTATWLALPGYRLAEITVMAGDRPIEATRTDDGNGYVFSMPTSDVTVTARFEKIVYTVSFYCNGELISQKTYFYGDTVELPDEPEGEAGHPFVKWSPEVTPVTGDAVYEAVFFSRGEGEPEETDALSGGHGLTIGGLVAIFASSWAVTCGGILTGFFLYRSRKSSRRNGTDPC